MACKIAAASGWDDADQSRMYVAGIAHDIGKIGIDAKVLRKTAPLTLAEYKVLQQHPNIGVDLAERFLCRDQLEWVKHHHEKPNGHGYPDQLDRFQITEGAAILALADTW